MTVRVVWVCAEGKEKEAYKAAASGLGIDVVWVPSLGHLHAFLLENPCNGVIVDLKTRIKAPGKEKRLVHQVLESYPVAEVTLDHRTGSISVLFSGQAGGEGSLASFIAEKCRSFAPRSIRADSRKNVNLNVLVLKNSAKPELEAQRTVTINLSGGGCFLYAVEPWERGAVVSLVFKELADDQPVRGDVRRVVRWGERTEIPGIGVRFLEIDDAQLAELCERFLSPLR